jgi:hypothetical protein
MWRKSQRHKCKIVGFWHKRELPDVSSNVLIWRQSRKRLLARSISHFDPKRTRQMIRLADGVVFDYVVPIFNMVTSTAKDSNGA